MSPIRRVRRARTVLVGTVLITSVLWAAVSAAGVLGLAVIIDLVAPLSYEIRQGIVPVAALFAVLAALRVSWRGRNAWSLGRVALYLEERLPDLQFALTTVVQPAGTPPAATERALQRAVDRVDAKGALRAPVLRAIVVPFVLFTLGFTLFSTVPEGVLERVFSPVPAPEPLTPILPVEEAPVGSRLAPVTVTVEPAAYTRQDAYELDDPVSVAALVGSRVGIHGEGATLVSVDDMGAVVESVAEEDADPEPLALETDDDEWSVSLTMSSTPAIVRLRDREYDRLIVLEPIPDAPPTLRLVSPPNDTSLTEPEGTLEVDARIADDIGLARAEIEMMYTSGGGERFDTERYVLNSAAYAGEQEARLRATIDLDTMGLGPGDVLHIRALAWDENDVTGPGRGESETRTIEIVDPRETADPNITAAAAAAIDTSIISQRMLIMKAESLLVSKPQLEEREYTQQSLDLSLRQGDLRGRVESIIRDLEYLPGVGFVGQTPSSMILRDAAEEMQLAERELTIASVPIAIVHMRKALEYLEELRDTNRYWLRGLLTTTPVDVERVRMSGQDPARVGGRIPLERLEDIRRILMERLDRAMAMSEEDPAMAQDTLQRLFAASLTYATDVSEPLDEAVEAIRRGESGRPHMIEARRRLERRVETRTELPSWFGVP